MLFLRLSKINSFQEMQDTLKESKADVSIWGGRRVHIRGYYFSKNLDDIAFNIFQRIKNNKYEFSDHERIQGKNIEHIIDDFYKKTDEEFKNTKNPLKKSLFYIRNIFLEMFNSSWHWTWKCHGYFDLYTYDQYKKTFNQEPPSKPTSSEGPRWKYPN